MTGFGQIKEVGAATVSLIELGPNEVYLNDELNPGAGDKLQVFAAGRLVNLDVKGIVRFEGSGTDESAMLMPLEAAQRLSLLGQVLDLLAAVSGDLLAHQLVAGAKDVTAGLVAQAGHEVGGAHHVREEDGNGAFRKLLSQRSAPSV